VAQVVRTKLILLIASAVAAAACDHSDGTGKVEAPRAVATADWPAAKVIDAILDECHGGLYRDASHREGMDHVACNVTLHGAAAASDGEVVQVFADLPARLRVQRPDGRMFVLLGDEAMIYGSPTAPVPAADATWLRQLRAIVDAAALGALYRCQQPTRTAADAFALPQPDGSTSALALRPGTLLPAAIASHGDRVEIVDYLRPGPHTTWIASRLRLPGFGECELSFTGYGMPWDAEFFDARGLDTAAPARTRTMTLGGGNPEQRPSQPDLGHNKAASQVVFADPGSWSARAAAYQLRYAELERQHQFFYGFPAFFRRDGADWMAIGFRQRDGGPAFAAPADWRIEALPDTDVLQVYPTSGSYEAKVAHGSELLQQALTARGLQATGPFVAQPYLHFERGEPPAAKLQEPVVRVSVAVR
jgi:hypothetical protein